ncbi:MAG: S-layer homology domain-containing protein [Firmicutes bacterium]|nr:S-layer homology domain-containing protein [Bacillota bacterium]MDH7496762.1 S-layer homology domain-containing protein [Bacillota bacterium]
MRHERDGFVAITRCVAITAAVLGAILASSVLAAAAAPTLASVGNAASRLKDVELSWAHDAIVSLVDEGIISGYPDGTFKPENPVTRAEFSKMVARAFAIRPTGEPRFDDIKDSWAKAYVTALAEAGIVSGYPDGTFKPERHITRAEMVAMLVRVAKLAEKMDSLEEPEPSFTDVTPDHWAFRAVETAHALGILPIHFGVVFEPDAATTRAETAWMVKSLVDLKITEGKLASVDTREGTIKVTTPGNTEQVITCGLDTRIYRNTVATSLDKLLRGDDVYVVADAAGEPKFIKARGLVTKDDLTAKVSILSKGTLTAPDVEALARGDWNSVKEGLQPRLIQRLVERGLTEEEATSLVNQDWAGLGDLAKKRLAEALSAELGISPDLVTAVLSQDWKLAKTYGEIEVAQYLLGRILDL